MKTKVKHTEVKVTNLKCGGVLLGLFSSLILSFLVVDSKQGDIVCPVLARNLLESQLEDLRVTIIKVRQERESQQPFYQTLGARAYLES